MNYELLVTILGMVAAAGVAWGGARSGASSIASDLGELKKDFKEHCESDLRVALRVERVDTLVTAVHGATVLKRRDPMALDYTTLQAWVLARAVRPELTTEVATFIRECETLIRAKVEAIELRVTLLEVDRDSEGIYLLNGQVREVRAAYATSASGESYPLENVGVAGIRQLRADADVFHYALVGQTIEFRGVPATDAELELVTLGWPAPLASTSTNELLDNFENLYTFGTLHYLYSFTQDLELAADAMNEFTSTAELVNKLNRRRTGGSSVLPFYNFGQRQIGRGR